MAPYYLSNLPSRLFTASRFLIPPLVKIPFLIASNPSRMVELQRFSLPMMRASCWVSVSSLTATAFLRSSSSRAFRSAMRRGVKRRFPVADACQVVSATGSLRCIILKLDMLTGRITKSKPSLIIFICNNKIT